MMRVSVRAVVALFALTLHASERDALRSLYEALQGEQWEHREGWLSDAQICKWHGVTVQDGHVVEVDLADNRLIGPLPEGLDALGRLSHLKVLDLRWNAIWGEIPDSVADMANLESLLLSDNQLAGHIPSVVGSMPALKRLDLSYNQLSGEIPKVFGESRSLQALGLQHNQLTGSLPRELAQIGTLRRLIVHGNLLTGAVPHEFDQRQGIHLKFTGGTRGVERSEEISGLDVFNETTVVVDEEVAGLFREVMAAVVVRDGELHVDSTKVLFPPVAAQLKRVTEGVNQRMRKAGETIRSVSDLERAFERDDQGTVELYNPAMEIPHSGEFMSGGLLLR